MEPQPPLTRMLTAAVAATVLAAGWIFAPLRSSETSAPVDLLPPDRDLPNLAVAVPAPREQPSWDGACTSTWYGRVDGFHGRQTASGETFDADAMTAAHRTLPFGTVLVVESTVTGRSVTVTINDRGPWIDIERRCLDLARAAFDRLGLGPAPAVGLAQVRWRIVR